MLTSISMKKTKGVGNFLSYCRFCCNPFWDFTLRARFTSPYPFITCPFFFHFSRGLYLMLQEAKTLPGNPGDGIITLKFLTETVMVCCGYGGQAEYLFGQSCSFPVKYQKAHVLFFVTIIMKLE